MWRQLAQFGGWPWKYHELPRSFLGARLTRQTKQVAATRPGFYLYKCDRISILAHSWLRSLHRLVFDSRYDTMLARRQLAQGARRIALRASRAGPSPWKSVV